METTSSTTVASPPAVRRHASSPKPCPQCFTIPRPPIAGCCFTVAPSGQILKIGSERPLDEVSEREPALLSNQPGDVLLWPSTTSATLQFPRPSREPPSRRVGFENVVPHSIDLSRMSVQHTHTHTRSWSQFRLFTRSLRTCRKFGRRRRLNGSSWAQGDKIDRHLTRPIDGRGRAAGSARPSWVPPNKPAEAEAPGD